MQTRRGLILLFIAAVPFCARAATCVSQASGNWSSAAVWSACGGGVPGTTDTASIASGHTITVDSGIAHAAVITVRGTVAFSRTVSSTLTVTAGDITVTNSGTLDIGTAASPIPTSYKAVLVLAAGSGATRYGLVINSGGTFTSHGAVKSSAADALTDAPIGATQVNVDAVQTTGWAAGDSIILPPTEDSADGEELRTITGLSTASGVTTVSWTGAMVYNHTVTNGLRVANLTRNVMVRSSGTDTSNGGTSAYVRAESPSLSGFTAVGTEFAYLGTGRFDFSKSGLMVEGTGIISSSTIRNGWVGTFFHNPMGAQITHNVVYSNETGIVTQYGNAVTLQGNDLIAHPNGGIDAGVSSSGGNFLILNNHVYSYGAAGISLGAYDGSSAGNVVQGNLCTCGYVGIGIRSLAPALIRDNRIMNNYYRGLELTESGGNVLVGNESYANIDSGLHLESTETSLLSIGNRWHDNYGPGMRIQSGGHTVIGDMLYANGGVGFSVTDGSGTVLSGVRMGYNASGAASPDTGSEIAMNASASNHGLTLYGCRVNPTTGIPTTAFNKAGNALISYSQDFSSGTLRVYGDFVPTSEVVLDRSRRMVVSRATPIAFTHGDVSASVVQTVDANATDQAIIVRYDGAQWVVTGSASGTMGTFSGAISNQPFPASNPQFYLTLTPGLSPQAEDQVVFGLMAASPDLNVQKRLLFGSSNAAFNSGKSRLTAGLGVTVTAQGTTAEPTIIDRLSSGSTYYTFIASGPITLTNVVAQNMDANGFQLSGSNVVAISSVSFDNIGVAGGSYLTVTNLTSTLGLDGMSFNDSRGLTPYSVKVQGTDTGLAWVMSGFSGARSGDASDVDPNSRIYWVGSTLVGTPGGFTATAVADGIDLSWSAPAVPPVAYRGGYRLYSSTVSAAGPFALLTSPASTATTYSHVLLQPQTTYYYRLYATDTGGGVSASPASAQALTGDFTQPTVTLSVGSRTVGVSWTPAMTLTFNKTMPIGSVQSATTLRRLKNNLAVDVDEPWTATVSAGATPSQFTVASTAPLAGNSVYELAVSTYATDALGQALSSSSTVRFSTLIDRTERNVCSDAVSGTQWTIPPGALTENGYLSLTSGTPSSSSEAIQKLVAGTGDPLRRPLAGTLTDPSWLDAAGRSMATAFSSPVDVSIPYTETNGVINGSNPPILARNAGVYWLDTTTSRWIRLPSTIDTTRHVVTASVRQAAPLALFGAGDMELTDAHVFPVPWTPRSSRNGITFTGIGDNATIRIFTLSGILVREINVSAAMGEYLWDVKNADGEPVGTGVYYYEISNNAGRVTGKAAVLR